MGSSASIPSSSTMSMRSSESDVSSSDYSPRSHRHVLGPSNHLGSKASALTYLDGTTMGIRILIIAALITLVAAIVLLVFTQLGRIHPLIALCVFCGCIGLLAVAQAIYCCQKKIASTYHINLPTYYRERIAANKRKHPHTAS